VLDDAPPAPGRTRGALVRLSLPSSRRTGPAGGDPPASDRERQPQAPIAAH